MERIAMVVSDDDLVRTTIVEAGWRVVDRGAPIAVVDVAAIERVARGVAILAVGREEDLTRAAADDCVMLPLRPSELIARLGMLHRRLGRIERGPLRIDAAARQAYVGSQALSLTPTELSLLEILARDAGRAFHRIELLRALFATDLPAYARNVDCHVTRLRRKLEAAGLAPAPISTVHGTGYRFQLAAG
jgi:DNA-binding response OmpR family regulator